MDSSIYVYLVDRGFPVPGSVHVRRAHGCLSVVDSAVGVQGRRRLGPWMHRCTVVSFGILVYYFFQFMEVLKGNSPLLVTAKWAGASVSGAVAAIINGFLLGLIPPSIIIFIAMLAFTAGQLLLATLPRQHQGLAASLVSTVVNYSISIGLGIAGTVESNINHGGIDTLKGYRGACYTGVGLAGLGVFLAACFMFVTWDRSRKNYDK